MKMYEQGPSRHIPEWKSFLITVFIVGFITSVMIVTRETKRFPKPPALITKADKTEMQKPNQAVLQAMARTPPHSDTLKLLQTKVGNQEIQFLQRRILHVAGSLCDSNGACSPDKVPVAQDTFAAAVQASRILKVKGPPELKLYGLYQQATEGDITTPRPWIFGKDKWDAWNARKGLKQEVAQQKFLEYTMNLYELEDI